MRGAEFAKQRPHLPLPQTGEGVSIDNRVGVGETDRANAAPDHETPIRPAR